MSKKAAKCLAVAVLSVYAAWPLHILFAADNSTLGDFSEHIYQPSLQAGFAGFCFLVFIVLCAIIVWMIKNTIRLSYKLAEVIASNTGAIVRLNDASTVQTNLMVEVKDSLLSRPCMFLTAREMEDLIRSHKEKANLSQ